MLCKIVQAGESAETMRWRPAGSGPPPGAKGLGGAWRPEDAQSGWHSEELDGRRQAELADARQQGFQQGLQQGREEAARALQKTAEGLAQALAEAVALKRRVRSEAEMELVKLALAIARRILRRELATDPEAIQGVAHAALSKLQNREIHCVRIFPAGAEVLRACLERSGAPSAVQVISDPSLRAGDLLFETSAGDLDASIETQLQEIERGFADRLAVPAVRNMR